MAPRTTGRKSLRKFVRQGRKESRRRRKMLNGSPVSKTLPCNSVWVIHSLSEQKKDPGIPNTFPYKDQILAEVAEQRKLVRLQLFIVSRQVSNANTLRQRKINSAERTRKKGSSRRILRHQKSSQKKEMMTMALTESPVSVLNA